MSIERKSPNGETRDREKRFLAHGYNDNPAGTPGIEPGSPDSHSQHNQTIFFIQPIFVRSLFLLLFESGLFAPVSFLNDKI